jgi:hypothetical protein
MDSPFLDLLRNRINLSQIPFSERGSRLLVFETNHHLAVRLAERWFKRGLPVMLATCAVASILYALAYGWLRR